VIGPATRTTGFERQMKNKPDSRAVRSLVEEVVRSGRCTGCGLCESIAGRDRIRMGINMRGHMRPLVTGRVPEAAESTIRATCPGIRVSGTGRPDGHVQVHKVWGPVREVHRSWAASEPVRFTGAAGGTLTALSHYLLASGRVDAVLHVRASRTQPWLTDSLISTDRATATSGAQSRYGPAAPLVQVHRLLDAGQRFAVIAKPCDISAIRALAAVDPRVQAQARYLLTFFCGGVHDEHISTAVIRYHGVEKSDVSLFRYRGQGWPGPLRVQTTAGQVYDLPYPGAWIGKPWRYDMQFRCKICPDAVGEVADLSVPDGWILKDGKPVYDEAPGTNIVVIRTERGLELVQAAVAAGYLVLAPVTMEEVDAMHVNHLNRRLGAPAHALAMRLRGQPALSAPGYRTLLTAKAAGPRRLWRQFRGTLRRVRRGENREPVI
jgi:coenzyme F420 hydrogenase subunit beta